MTLKRLLKYLPLAILSVQLMYATMVVAGTDLMFTYKHYRAMVLVPLCIVLHFFNHRIAQIATLATILLGVVNVISFTPSTNIWSFWITRPDIGQVLRFQVFSFWVAVLFLIVNFSWVKARLEKYRR